MQLVETSTGEIVGEIREQSLILAGGAFRFTSTGLTVEGTPTFQEWESVGAFLAHIQKRIHWWIGDWLNYGEGQWGEDFAQAVDTERFSEQTLANDKWVASRVAPSLRKENLSFSHHALVAPSSPEEQKELLALAEREGWSTRELHRETKKRKRDKGNNPHSRKEITINALFIVQVNHLDRFKEATKKWGADLALLPGVQCIDFDVSEAK